MEQDLKVRRIRTTDISDIGLQQCFTCREHRIVLVKEFARRQFHTMRASRVIRQPHLTDYNGRLIPQHQQRCIRGTVEMKFGRDLLIKSPQPDRDDVAARLLLLLFAQTVLQLGHPRAQRDRIALPSKIEKRKTGTREVPTADQTVNIPRDVTLISRLGGDVKSRQYPSSNCIR